MSYRRHAAKDVPSKIWVLEVPNGYLTYAQLKTARSVKTQKQKYYPNFEFKIWESDPIAWNEVH